ncbi:hypothetical protein ECRM12761_27295 (plasmid) [Escherichia coli O145:H28 str. RM12761]|nr:hypothetical protein ECRM13516_5591 [Escherichia coli O145:H28 str. RM13516]AHY68376.1 hypothetical protein ECRM12761_27295 [Escherichia coli O145:H28 str. RM12761]EGD68155.1 hypothetical protein ECF_01697 [Escherichia coli O157:H7 str. 1125]UVD62209.1 hypothetical protein N10II_016 [Escherichia coli]
MLFNVQDSIFLRWEHFVFFDGFNFSGKMNVSDKQTYYQEVNKYPE